METDHASAGDAPPAPTLPDFFTDPNAVLRDETAEWRFGKRPDYAKTRKFYYESKKSNHEVGSLPELVENLVKNWEIEASFKTRFSDWRTVNHDRYTFSMNGGPVQKSDYMLKNGTYNAILSASEFYDPEHMDFSVSHKTFKRMMPVFAWEVLEVYCGPPKVAFRWRHWGYMKFDYVAINCDGDKVTSKAHGNLIDIEGVTVADLDDAMKVVHLETWFDPRTFFEQIAPDGITKVKPHVPSTADFKTVEQDLSYRHPGTHIEDPRPGLPELRNLQSGQNNDVDTTLPIALEWSKPDTMGDTKSIQLTEIASGMLDMIPKEHVSLQKHAMEFNSKTQNSGNNSRDTITNRCTDTGVPLETGLASLVIQTPQPEEKVQDVSSSIGDLTTNLGDEMIATGCPYLANVAVHISEPAAENLDIPMPQELSVTGTHVESTRHESKGKIMGENVATEREPPPHNSDKQDFPGR